jgi:hypothetical protein
VAFRFHEGPNLFDFTALSDEERTAHDAHEGAAHELLFLPGAELLSRFVSRVAEQWEIEFVLLLEGGLGFDGIGAHAEDGDAEFVEVFFCVTKLGRFDGSTRSVGFREKEEQDSLAAKIRERDVFSLVGLETEAGSFGAGLEHKIPRCKSYQLAEWGAAMRRPYKCSAVTQ